MRLLIDGYNLLYQSDLVGKGRGPRWLEKARGRLIKAIDSRLPASFHRRTLIVFDAKSKGLGSADEQDNAISFGGVDISYATAYAEADDYLEKLIREHPTPKKLLVVSSDQRIQRCAAACRANFEDSYSWYQWLQRQQPSTSAVNNPDSLAIEQPTLTDAEVSFWLKEFDKPTPDIRPSKRRVKSSSSNTDPSLDLNPLNQQGAGLQNIVADSSADAPFSNLPTAKSKRAKVSKKPAQHPAADSPEGKPMSRKTNTSKPGPPKKTRRKKDLPDDRQRAKRNLPAGENLFPPGYAEDVGEA